MKITLQKFYKGENLKVDYTQPRIIVKIEADNAHDCMETVKDYRNSNELNWFTPWEIINVED